MNIEFLVHGILKGGQAFWKDVDTDYCSRFYVPFSGEVKIDVEVIKQNGGKGATYYTYLRYNNVAAPGRSGSYFGMTVRVDEAICCDVINMYRLLDTIFDKCVVGTILKVENNKYVYACDSFKAIDADLRDIENKFGMMCGAVIFQKDYIGIPASYKRQTGSYNIHIDDINSKVARETLLAGNKLCVSPFFPTKQSQNAQSQILTIQNEAVKQIKAAQEECAKQIQTKTQELEQANNAASTGKAQHKKEVEDLKKQLQDKEDELAALKADFRKKEQNVEINRVTKELQETLSILSGLLAERFPETGSADSQTPAASSENDNEKKAKTSLTSFKKPLITTIGAIAIAAIVYCALYFLGFFGTTEPTKPAVNIEYQPEQTEENESSEENVAEENAGDNGESFTQNVEDKPVDVPAPAVETKAAPKKPTASKEKPKAAKNEKSKESSKSAAKESAQQEPKEKAEPVTKEEGNKSEMTDAPQVSPETPSQNPE